MTGIVSDLSCFVSISEDFLQASIDYYIYIRIYIIFIDGNSWPVHGVKYSIYNKTQYIQMIK